MDQLAGGLGCLWRSTAGILQGCSLSRAIWELLAAGWQRALWHADLKAYRLADDLTFTHEDPSAEVVFDMIL